VGAGFPDGTVVKNPCANAGDPRDAGLIPGLGRSPGEGNGVALIVNRRLQNAVLGCNLKNDRMILVHFQGKSSNITVIQLYASTTNAEEAKVEWFHEDLQYLLELTPKNSLYIIRDLNAKVECQEIAGVTGKFGL